LRPNVEIPEEILIQMKDFSNADQFVYSLVDRISDPNAGSEVNGTDQVSLAYLQRGYETTEAEAGGEGSTGTPVDMSGKRIVKRPKIAAPAGCASEMRTVELETPGDQEMYYPWCVRLPRCSGCCPSTRLECVPTKVSYIDVPVLRLKFENFNKKFELKGIKTFKMLRHDSCACQCIEQPEDCSAGQDYKPEECRCVCRDLRAADLCLASSSVKVWSKEWCSCSCRHSKQCSTGLTFDPNSCRCVTSDLSIKKQNDVKYRLSVAENAKQVAAAVQRHHAADDRELGKGQLKGQGSPIEPINPDVQGAD
jgi:hypothetical protein